MGLSDIQRAITFAPEEISALVNHDVLEQHLRNVSFLWFMRNHACLAPNYSLSDLVDLDERVDANLNGLAVAGDAGWELVSHALEHDEPGEAFATGFLAFPGEDGSRIATAVEAGCASPELAQGVISSLGWLPFVSVEQVIYSLLKSEDSRIRSLGIAACSISRHDPGLVLDRSLSDSDTSVRSRALRAAGELGRMDLLPLLSEFLADTDEPCRFWAAWSSARMGGRDSKIYEVLRGIAESSSPLSGRALEMALLCVGTAAAGHWVRELFDNRKRLGALGAGMLGDPTFMEDLIALMRDKRTARLAGEAFSRITGVDLSYEDFGVGTALDAGFDPDDNDEEEEVAFGDLEDGLPWPKADLVGQWWSKHSQRFCFGSRYLLGKEITPACLVTCLRDGSQRQRAAAALEWALLKPGMPLFEVRAKGGVQIQGLKSWTS